MSGAQLTHAGDRLVGVERRGGLKRILRELEIAPRGLHAGVDQGIQREKVRRRILRQHKRLAAQIGDRLDCSRAPRCRRRRSTSRPADRSRGITRESRWRLSRKSGTMSSVRPADVDVARGVGVAHRHRIVDQRQLDFEVLTARRFQTFPALKPLFARMIGAQPAHTFIANRTVRSAIGL